MGLRNVTFMLPQPRSVVPDLYRLSDAVMVLLRNVPLFHSTIPSKIFEIMACGVPIILGVAGETQQIVEEAGAGLCIEPENADELASAILKILNNPRLRSRLTTEGRSYVSDQHDRRHLAEQYLGILEEVIATRRA
jgi:colanic acid biosynthesis glycosyl transferase WcaI